MNMANEVVEATAVAETPTESGIGSEGTLDLGAAQEEIVAGLGLDLQEEKNEELETGLEGGAKPAAPVASPAPAPAAAAPTGPSPAPAPNTPFSADKAPHTWTPAIQAKWAALDPEVRAEIAKRENDMVKGIAQYKGASDLAKDLATALRPVIPDLQRHQVTPQTFIGNLTAAHVALSNHNVPMEQRAAQALQYLKTSYGIDLVAEIKKIPAQEEAFVDPQVKGLRDQITSLQSRLDEGDSRTAAQIRTSLSNEVMAFASDPANLHFNDVADDIALLLHGSRAAGQPLSLKDAYDKAVYANPLTRAKGNC
jgi:hypothetical protein